MNFAQNHASRALWAALDAVKPYPSGVVAVQEQIAGTSFFPGGTGIWCGDHQEVPPLPVGGVIVLGHDFHSVAGYEWSLENGAENLSSPISSSNSLILAAH